MSIKRISSLDGWRAVSIFLVIISHQLQNNFADHSSGVLRSLSSFNIGRYGVYIFFVISGFIITTLFVQEKKDKGRISLLNFFIKRIFRILPVYYLYLLVIFLLYAVADVPQIGGKIWLKAVLFMSNFKFWGDNPWCLNHSWSLSVEEQYYLMWPFVFRFGIKMFPYVVVAIFPVMRLFYYLNMYDMNVISFTFNADCIFWGAIFAMNYKTPLFDVLMQRVKMMMALFFVLLIGQKIHIPFCLPIFHALLPTFFSVFVIFFITYSFEERNVLYKVLNSKPMVYIGTISYSLYLWQQLFYSRLSVLGDHWYTTFPFNIVVMVMVSYLSYLCIELPFLAWRNKVLKYISG